MLPRKYRISKNNDFQRIFQEGKSFKEKFLILKFKKNNLNFSRFGFIISNKVSKKSVERHKIKRRLNEIIRLKLPEIRKGYDIIIIATPEIKNRTYQEIEKVLIEIFKKTGL